MKRSARRQASGNPSRDTENLIRRSSSRRLAASSITALNSSAALNPIPPVPKASLHRTAIVTLTMLSVVA